MSSRRLGWLAAVACTAVVAAGCEEVPGERAAEAGAPARETVRGERSETAPGSTTPPTTIPATVPSTIPVIPTTAVPDPGWTVRWIVDGDTIEVAARDGTTHRVRLIGIDTPETGECYGGEATAALADLLPLGSPVALIRDVSETDRYGRLLRYVERTDPSGVTIDVGAELVAAGYARSVAYPPDTARLGTYDELAAAAAAARLGRWAPGVCAPPATTAAAGERPPTTNATATTTSSAPVAIVPAAGLPAPDCDPSYPTLCLPVGAPDLDCGDLSERRFPVLPPDPHRFDGDHDGVGCER